MTRFEILDHTADIGLQGYGKTLEELFAHMALGMFSLIAETTTIQPMASIPILAQAEGPELLLAAWLREILFAAARDQMVFVNCRVHQVMPAGMTGEVTGEVADPQRQTIFREIKAVTQHALSVRQEGDLWTARVLFDV